MEERTIGRSGSGTIVLGYRAVARKGEGGAYTAYCTPGLLSAWTGSWCGTSSLPLDDGALYRAGLMLWFIRNTFSGSY